MKFRQRVNQQSSLVSNARNELAKLGVKPVVDPNATPIEQYKVTLEQLDKARLAKQAQSVQLASSPTVQAPYAAPTPVTSSVPASPAPVVAAPGPLPTTELVAEASAFKNTRLANGYTLEAAPPEFETVTETVVVQEASVEYVTVPPTYETYTETIVVQEASTELVTIPAQYLSLIHI